jgi:hypothetical protein
MLDRSDRVRRRTITTPAVKPVPMPGRLTVTYYNARLRADRDTVIAGLESGVRVSASGVITLVRYLAGDRSRAHVVLTGEDGQSALAVFDADALAGVQEDLLRCGTRVIVTGRVEAATSMTPASITAYSVRVVR